MTETTKKVKFDSNLRALCEAAVKKMTEELAMWTPEEDALLDEFYPKLGATRMQSVFTRHTVQSIRKRANHRGIRYLPEGKNCRK